MAADRGEYLLGANRAELERLRFQHTVWRDITNSFLDRIGVGPGWRCLDVGGGPGFVAMDLRKRVGDLGEVTLLEPSTLFVRWFEQECKHYAWDNVKCIQATAEQAALPQRHFDLIFVRWVIAFVSDPEAFIRCLVPALRPGGVIAFQDYYYEGLSLFPHGGAFDRMAEIVRAYYRSGGGDAYVTGKIPGLLRQCGVRVADYSPHSLAGGPGSDVMEWAHGFFLPHIPLMAGKGLVSEEQADELLADWEAHRMNPEALFFSPIVVDVAGKAPE